MMRKADVGLAIAGVALFLIGCSDHNPTDSSRIEAELAVEPEEVVAEAVGDTLELNAAALTPSGDVIPSVQLTWESSDSTVAVVNGAGRVITRGVGIALITVSGLGQKASAKVEVRNRVDSIAISPSAPEVLVKKTVRLKATAFNRHGKPIDDAAITWSSSNGRIAHVDRSGIVTGNRAGTATITASSGGKTGSVKVTVKDPEPEPTEPKEPTEPNEPKEPKEPTKPKEPAEPEEPEEPAEPAPPAPVASVTVSPASGDLEVGKTLQLEATLKDADGAVLEGRTIEWTSSNPAVATVSATGLVKAVASGTAVIRASSEGKSAEATITVNNPITTPPPSSGNVAPVFRDDFETGKRASPQGGYQWKGTPGNITVSSEIARSGRYSLKFVYTGKENCKDATAEQRFAFGERLTEVWLEWYIYFPDGTEGVGPKYHHRSQSGCPSSATNNKFIRIWGNDYNAPNKVGAETWATGGGDSRLDGMAVLNGSGPIRYIGRYGSFINDGTRGRWVQIRAHFKLADIGKSNGIVRFWVDGKLVIDERSVAVYSTNGLHYWDQGYLLGWANSGFNENTPVFVDDFVIYNRNPGW